MLDPRIYRAALAAVLLAVIVCAFSLGDQPAPVRTTLAPDAFTGQRATQELNGLASRYPLRRPGDAQDEALAREIAATFRSISEGFSVSSSRALGETIDGERHLTTVIARQAGAPGGGLVVVAHRDAAGRGARAELSGTAAMLELARVVSGQLRRSITFASTSGGSGGAAGASASWPRLAGRTDAVLVLGDLAGERLDRPLVTGWSNEARFAPLRLRRTVEAAVRAEAGTDPGTTRASTQWARLAFPFTMGEQGPLVDARPARGAALGERGARPRGGRRGHPRRACGPSAGRRCARSRRSTRPPRWTAPRARHRDGGEGPAGLGRAPARRGAAARAALVTVVDGFAAPAAAASRWSRGCAGWPRPPSPSWPPRCSPRCSGWPTWCPPRPASPRRRRAAVRRAGADRAGVRGWSSYSPGCSRAARWYGRGASSAPAGRGRGRGDDGASSPPAGRRRAGRDLDRQPVGGRAVRAGRPLWLLFAAPELRLRRAAWRSRSSWSARCPSACCCCRWPGSSGWARARRCGSACCWSPAGTPPRRCGCCGASSPRASCWPRRWPGARARPSRRPRSRGRRCAAAHLRRPRLAGRHGVGAAAMGRSCSRGWSRGCCWSPVRSARGARRAQGAAPARRPPPADATTSASGARTSLHSVVAPRRPDHPPAQAHRLALAGPGLLRLTGSGSQRCAGAGARGWRPTCCCSRACSCWPTRRSPVAWMEPVPRCG